MPTQTINTATHITFSADNQTWIIAPDVIVSDDTYSIAVEGLTANVGDTLVNHGTILSPYPEAPGFTVAGVAIGGSGDVVLNEADGVITGLNGIVCGGFGSFVRNAGSVTGFGNAEDGVTFVGSASSAQLFNSGSIYGQSGGVVVATTNSSVVNEAEGTITGSVGIAFTDQGDTLNNCGSINALGFHGVSFQGGANFVHFTNSGHIFGPSSGVIISSGNVADSSLSNSGVIESNQYGLWLSNGSAGAGRHDAIVNTGTISGSVAAIFADAGDRIVLTNAGTLIGDVLCKSVNATDTVINTGKIDGTVHLGSGDDSFSGAGGSSGAILGEAGNDQIVGGSAADWMSGGLGNDTLTGGPGADHFVFDAALGPTNIDHITDFTHGVDKIDLSHAIFGAVGGLGKLAAAAFFAGAAAHDRTDRIIYNPANGFVTYDSNGNHAGGAHHFATLAAHLHLTNADFLVVA
jgi:Ca2+-binding RTX toxin-like protein